MNKPIAVALIVLGTGVGAALWPHQVFAADANAGVVKRVSAPATLERATATRALAVGQAVQVGDIIRTGQGGGASITLADDTLLSAGPESELVITQFAFDPTSQEGGMLLSLWRGVLSVVTGVIARVTPEKVNVQTRTVVLGVRGTEFIVDAGKGAP